MVAQADKSPKEHSPISQNPDLQAIKEIYDDIEAVNQFMRSQYTKKTPESLEDEICHDIIYYIDEIIQANALLTKKMNNLDSIAWTDTDALKNELTKLFNDDEINDSQKNILAMFEETDLSEIVITGKASEAAVIGVNDVLNLILKAHDILEPYGFKPPTQLPDLILQLNDKFDDWQSSAKNPLNNTQQGTIESFSTTDAIPIQSDEVVEQESLSTNDTSWFSPTYLWSYIETAIEVKDSILLIAALLQEDANYETANIPEDKAINPTQDQVIPLQQDGELAVSHQQKPSKQMPKAENPILVEYRLILEIFSRHLDQLHATTKDGLEFDEPIIICYGKLSKAYNLLKNKIDNDQCTIEDVEAFKISCQIALTEKKLVGSIKKPVCIQAKQALYTLGLFVALPFQKLLLFATPGNKNLTVYKEGLPAFFSKSDGKITVDTVLKKINAINSESVLRNEN